MPFETTDTIAAVATGSGKAGIGIVRVSGPLAPAIGRSVTGQELRPRYAHYLSFYNQAHEEIDRGLAILFEAPNSLTGESVLELQGHGGPVVLNMVLVRVMELGARLARPGEFTERAFYNDKIDLAQAEAVSDLIDSSSQAAAKAALRSLSGTFSREVNNLVDDLIALRVWLEAALDFSEEDIDFLAETKLQQRAADLVNRFDELTAKAAQGQRLRDGMIVVIAGVANAGKSSLLNQLAERDMAIVTPIAGTTRDVLSTDITLEGVPLHVIDTAGLRETSDQVERLGIERARRAVEEADHVLIILDATQPQWPDGINSAPEHTSVVVNKKDLVAQDALAELMRSTGADVAISAKTGDGIAALRSRLLSLAGHDASVENVLGARQRHMQALLKAGECTRSALDRLHGGHFPELAAEELNQAQLALEAITGRYSSDDLLGEIFGSFCIGK